jgi:hypothetical protein
MRWSAILVLVGVSTLALAQESALTGELRRESERVADACQASFKAVPVCAYTLFTDHPLHIAAGSMPPQNGFGFGGAFVWSKNTRNWRMSWDLDAMGAFSGSWRAGGYMKMIHTPHPATPRIQATHPYTVFNFYVQTISLNKLNFFGLGNNTALAGKSLFGMNETIVGVSAIKPVFEWKSMRWLNLSLLGEVNGRFVDIRGEHGESSPSIETLYSDRTAPGLGSQPGFAQLSEGVRIKPAIGSFLRREAVNRFENANTRVIHQDIDATESCCCLLDEVAAVLVVADVRDHSSGGGFGAESMELVKRRLQRYRITATDKYASAFLDQSLGDTQSNAPCGTRYERDLALKFQRQNVPFRKSALPTSTNDFPALSMNKGRSLPIIRSFRLMRYLAIRVREQASDDQRESNGMCVPRHRMWASVACPH